MSKRIDLGMIIAVGILCMIGLLMIYSTANTAIFIRQGIWLVIGIITATILSRISPRVLAGFAPFFYTVIVVLLFLILVTGDSYPKRWFKFEWLYIQPSEFAKLSTIIFLASVLAAKKSLSRFTDILVPLAIVALPAILIFLEPDLGATQIFFPILIIMLYWAGMSGAKIFIFFSPLVSAIASFSIYVWVIYFIALIIFLYFKKHLAEFVYGMVGNVLAGLIMPIVWNSLKAYQQQRIISFFSPWVDPRGMSWQSIQSKIAIGSGGIIGKGFLSGTQKKLEFLPERHTDFIFSCLGEEFGLLGIALTLIAFVYLFYKILTLARETKNRFASILVIGIFGWFTYQTLINIGVTMGLFPVTGVPLLFVSYGGSSLLASFIAIGISLAISKSRFTY